jgi:hypothetical protein
MSENKKNNVIELEVLPEKINENSEQSIEKIINGFVHRVLDTEECANNFIDLAIDNYNSRAESLGDEMKSSLDLISTEESSGSNKAQALKNIRRSIRKINRHNNSSPVKTLEKSLFINLFADFDKYIGELITALYALNTNLYKNINREISLSEALTFESIDDMRSEALSKEIESLRRKSYSEQLKDIQKRFSISLQSYNKWDKFIEMSQRRNLFTHCDGIVSSQYIDACKEHGYQFKEEPAIGSQLSIGDEYFYKSCNLITEIGVMLGQTLWRKVSPESIENADSQLSNLIFDFLHNESWSKAKILSKFALNLPKISNEQKKRIFVINYAIALKFNNQKEQMEKLLDEYDWSATSNDFKLAHAVLIDNFDEAKVLMESIGDSSELISEISYLDWPLFRDFRNQEQFFEAYKNIYGYEYSSKLISLAEALN